MDSATTAGRFNCDSCGASFRWKPELAGKKAKCKCGATIACPQTDPSVPAVVDDVYDLAPDADAPAARRPAPVMPVASVATVAAAAPVMAQAMPGVANVSRAAPLAYHTPKHDVDVNFPNRTLDLHMPVALIIGSIVIEIATIYLNPALRIQTFGQLMMSVGLGLIISTVFILIGIVIAAKVRHFSLGTTPSMILKLIAISLAPAAAMDLAWLPLRFVFILGIILDWLVGFMLYFALIGAFFELDQSDTWYCVVVIFLIKLFTAILLVVGIASLMIMLHMK